MDEEGINNQIINFMKKLYLDNDGDITINLSDKTNIKVISYIIKKKSKIFNNMFNNDMKENITKSIDMTTYDPISVKNFFAYLYYNEVYNGNDIDVYFELLYLNEQYDQKDYFACIKNKIIKIINDTTITTILNKCLECESISDEIYKKGIEYICENSLNCYDLMSDDPYAWCCKHSIKNTQNYYKYYEHNGTNSCISYNLLNKCKKGEGLNYSLEGKEIPDNVYKDRCCIHKNNLNINYEIVKEMDEKIKDDILKFLFK
jgi:hypothetical protein